MIKIIAGSSQLNGIRRRHGHNRSRRNVIPLSKRSSSPPPCWLVCKFLQIGSRERSRSGRRTKSNCGDQMMMVVVVVNGPFHSVPVLNGPSLSSWDCCAEWEEKVRQRSGIEINHSEPRDDESSPPLSFHMHHCLLAIESKKDLFLERL